MRQISARLRRIESAVNAANAERRKTDRLLRHRICATILVMTPELAEVTPEDTDPETFRGIQETIAWAKADYERAEALLARAPRDEGYAAALAEENGDIGRAIRRVMREGTPAERRREEATEAAVLMVRSRQAGRA